MTPSDPISWSEIEAAAARVLDAPADARAGILDELARGHPGLHAEVCALLDADATCGDFLERGSPGPIVPRPAPATAARDATPEAPLVPGHEVIRTLGEGGMGTVVLARPSDDPVSAPVAIKLLHRDVTDDTALRRFEREGVILAALRHRHIARHLDQGTALDGRPYLVMEVVDGLPITAYADRHRLTVDDRLRLLRDACRGVGHAHRNHVVHRDLKPSNVLVDGDATVKVLDFGIARWLDGHAPDGGAPLTRTEQRVLTPRYASPEQIRGDVVGPASDVFALGLLLFELLTGRHPHAGSMWSVGETERAILDVDAPAPSEVARRTEDIQHPDGRTSRLHPARVAADRGLSADELHHRLVGDVDAIVARALARTAEARYPHADAMALDLERVLAGEPIAGPRGSRWHRARRLLSRRPHAPDTRTGSGSRVREAARQVRRADSMMNFLVRMFERIGPTGGDPDLRARDLLDWAALHVDDELGDEPDARVDLLTTLGRIYHEIGDTRAALPVLERAVATGRRLHGDGDPRLVDTLRHLATVQQELADFDAAEATFREALTIAREGYGEHHLEVASRMNDLAILLVRRGDPSRARALHEDALRIKRRHLPDDDVSVLATLNNLGVLLQRMGHAREAEHLLRQVLAARRRRYGNEHVHVANALSNLMIAARRLGDLDTALPLAREALELRVRLLGSDHPDVAVSRFNLASILRDLGQLDEAEHLFERAIKASAHLRGEHHPDTEGHRSGLAMLRLRQGRPEEAEAVLDAVTASMARSLGVDHPQVLNLELDRVRIQLARGRLEGARARAERVRDLRIGHHGPDVPLVAEARLVLGRVLLAEGRTAEGHAEVTANLALLTDAWGRDHPEVVRGRASLGEAAGGPGPGHR